MTAKDNILSIRHAPERCFPPQREWSELTLRCPRTDFSASLIARAVEDCDAHLLNMNVTSIEPESYGDVSVDIRVNVRNGYGVARSLERYGFEVDQIVGDGDAGSEPLTDTMRDRIDLLLKNLEL
ncbi:MAG: hypothetical protein NC336_01275 [Clostridium sp.]|nr:hypothetical protein [Clostridium sp.]